MYSVLLTIHVLVTLFLIGIILMQRSASDGMGLSGSSSTSFLSGRAAASAVTRATSVLAALFILTSLGLGIITAHSHGETSILDKPATAPLAPDASSSVTPQPTEPARPATAPAAVAPAPKPSVPRPQ